MKIVLLFLIIACNCTLFAQNFKNDFYKGKEYKEKGLYAEALTYYNKAEQHKISSGQQMLLWTDMALCYKQTANYNKALLYYEKLLDLLRESPRQNEILLNQSDLYLQMGRYDKVIAILSDLNVSRGEDTQLINLSTAYARLGQNEKALEILGKAQKRHESTKDSIYAIAISNKGYILWSMNRFEESIQELNNALPLFKHPANRYICMGNLALVEAGCHHFEKALSYINECIIWQEKHIGENHPDCIISIRKKAEILLKMNDIPKATDAFKVFFKREKNYIISNFAYMSEQERIDFWNTQKELISECYAIGTFDPLFLFDIAVFSKSVLLQANRNFLQLVSGNDEQAALYKEIKEIRYQIRTSTQIDTIQLLEENVERLERQLMAKLDAYRYFVDDLKTDATDIRSALKNKKDVAIEFVQYKKADTIHYAALLMQKREPVQFIPLFSQNEIENYYLKGRKILGTLKEAVYSRDDIDKNRLYTDTLLGHKIWKPMLKYIPKKANIYFSPEGIFHLLAIEYLCFGREDCDLYRLSSTRYLCNQKKEKRTASSIMLVGGLNYDDTTSIIHHTYPLPDRTTSIVLGRDGVAPVEGDGYNYLEGSLTEIDSILPLYSKSNLCFFKGHEGTEDAIKKEIANYHIIHISTHGFCVDYQIVPPLLYLKDNISEDLSLSRCGILLSGANLASKQNHQNNNVEDGILSARELCDLDLSKVDLVTLSACQTGLGRITADGIAGLPRGLKKAGAESILVSLWEVNDKATQLMMHAFYQYLKNGYSKKQALTNAQNYLKTYKKEETEEISVPSSSVQSTPQRKKKKSDNYNKPCYWAAFVLIDGIN